MPYSPSAQAHGTAQDRFEHRLERRSASAMTPSTSEIAVWYSSASCRSRVPRVRACTSSNSRAFSMAITAWSVKVFSSSM